MTDFRPGGFQRLPLVVKNLIIINSLMLFAQIVLERFGIDLVRTPWSALLEIALLQTMAVCYAHVYAWRLYAPLL